MSSAWSRVSQEHAIRAIPLTPVFKQPSIVLMLREKLKSELRDGWQRESIHVSKAGWLSLIGSLECTITVAAPVNFIFLDFTPGAI